MFVFYDNIKIRDYESSLDAYNARRIMSHTNDVMIILLWRLTEES